MLVLAVSSSVFVISRVLMLTGNVLGSGDQCAYFYAFSPKWTSNPFVVLPFSPCLREFPVCSHQSMHTVYLAHWRAFSAPYLQSVSGCANIPNMLARFRQTRQRVLRLGRENSFPLAQGIREAGRGPWEKRRGARPEEMGVNRTGQANRKRGRR